MAETEGVMSTAWTHGPPSAEAVAAHARAHPWIDDTWGTWVVNGRTVRLSVADGGVISAGGGAHFIATVFGPDSRWLPVTAEALPVDYEALRAKMERAIEGFEAIRRTGSVQRMHDAADEMIAELTGKTPGGPRRRATIFECRCCDTSCRGFNDGTMADGWRRIANIDGPNAICPSCAADPTALNHLRGAYPNAELTGGNAP